MEHNIHLYIYIYIYILSEAEQRYVSFHVYNTQAQTSARHLQVRKELVLQELSQRMAQQLLLPPPVETPLNLRSTFDASTCRQVLWSLQGGAP